MVPSEALIELHERCHANLRQLLDHCRSLTAAELHLPLEGFGYPSVQEQLHHEIGAEKYWIGVLEGRIDVDDDAVDYPTVDALESYRQETFAITESYLRSASPAELDTPREVATWRGTRIVVRPALVILRTQVHLYHHQGQILAMCRLLGHPRTGLPAVGHARRGSTGAAP